MNLKAIIRKEQNTDFSSRNKNLDLRYFQWYFISDTFKCYIRSPRCPVSVMLSFVSGAPVTSYIPHMAIVLNYVSSSPNSIVCPKKKDRLFLLKRQTSSKKVIKQHWTTGHTWYQELILELTFLPCPNPLCPQLLLFGIALYCKLVVFWKLKVFALHLFSSNQ